MCYNFSRGAVMSNLLKKMQHENLLSQTEVIISKYLLNNYRELPKLSTRELAKKTFTSSAAVVRFCQKLGYEGYTDFKINFLAEMMKHGNEIQANLIEEQDNINLIMDKVRKININAIDEAYNMMNPAILSRTMKLFKKAVYIDFYTVDGFGNFASRTAENFSLVNKYSTVNSSMSIQYLQAYSTPKDHLGFFISPTGENRFLIDIATLLKRQSVPTVLITSSQNSTLADIVDETFAVNIGDNVAELGISVFLTGANFVTDTILATLMTQEEYKNTLEKESWLNDKLHY